MAIGDEDEDEEDDSDVEDAIVGHSTGKNAINIIVKNISQGKMVSRRTHY